MTTFKMTTFQITTFQMTTFKGCSTHSTRLISRPASKPDALKQLIQCFQRAATSEESQAISIMEDRLFVDYADVMAQSIHLEDDDDEGDEEKEVDQAEKEESAQALRAEQAILADRGASIMCLQYLSASNG